VERSFDRRWAKCRRPFIVSGGELSLDMLDLRYNATSKIYEAPFQLKANNGIYLIDDFGRQRATPAEVLNRWIVPMERRVDYLSFVTGGKMTVPFEAFLVFSTNLNPATLGDEAFLRRIQYKMLLRGPTENEFVRIFERFSASKGVPCPRELINRFIAKHYKTTGKIFRRCHPRDVLQHAFNLMHFEKMPVRLSTEILDRAFESCFLEENEDAAPLETPIVPSHAATPGTPTATPTVSQTNGQTCADYWAEQVSRIQAAFGRLAFAAQFRDRGIGDYRDGEATLQYDEAENAQVLMRMHGRLFREWLGLSLDQQVCDLVQYIASVKNNLLQPAFLQREWAESMTPLDAKQEEVQLFVQDLATGYNLVCQQSAPGPAPAPAISEQLAVAATQP
jgi:hypothetical protein